MDPRAPDRPARKRLAEVLASRIVGIGDRSVGTDIRIHVVGIPDMLSRPATYVFGLAVRLLRLLLQPFGLDSHLFRFGLLTPSLRLALAGVQRSVFALLTQVGSSFPPMLLMHKALAFATHRGDDADHDHDNND